MCPSVFFEKNIFRKQKLDIFFRLSGKDCRPSDSKHFVCVLKRAFIVSKEFFEEKQIFDGNVFFYIRCILSKKTGFSKRRSACLSGRFEEKKSLKKYSDVYFSWNKKNWDVWQKNISLISETWMTCDRRLVLRKQYPLK